MTITKEDNEQIELAKRIISKVFAVEKISMPAAILAMSELLIHALAHNVKDMAALKAESDRWYKNIQLELVYGIGQEEINNWIRLKALEILIPGSLQALSDKNAMSSSDGIKIVKIDDSVDETGKPHTKH